MALPRLPGGRVSGGPVGILPRVPRGRQSPRTSTGRSRRVRSGGRERPAVEPTGGRPTLDYAPRCVIAGKAGLEGLLAGAYQPLVAAVERPAAAAWALAGIPVELAERVIAERTALFRSSPHNR